MPFRFRKSIKLLPGVRLNFSRSGLSTSLGGRWLLVNLGGRRTRMTAGIPGTGISYLAGDSSGGGRRGGRWLGWAVAASLGLLVMTIGFRGRPDGRGVPWLVDTTFTVTAADFAPRERFYLHGALHVRTGPGAEFDVVRTLKRGDRVWLGDKDGNGWAPLFDRFGAREGYVYRASRKVRSYAPDSAAPRPRTRRHPPDATALCRDGTYSFSQRRRSACSWHGGVARWL